MAFHVWVGHTPIVQTDRYADTDVCWRWSPWCVLPSGLCPWWGWSLSPWEREASNPVWLPLVGTSFKTIRSDSRHVYSHVHTCRQDIRSTPRTAIKKRWLTRLSAALHQHILYLCVVAHSCLLTNKHRSIMLFKAGDKDNPTKLMTLVKWDFYVRLWENMSSTSCVLQEKQRSTFFSIFYLSINAGSLLSTVITPILKGTLRVIGVIWIMYTHTYIHT